MPQGPAPKPGPVLLNPWELQERVMAAQQQQVLRKLGRNQPQEASADPAVRAPL